MHIENLVTMLNQINSFFATEPDRELGIEGIRNHVQRFWEPRMRRLIIAHVQAGGGRRRAPGTGSGQASGGGESRLKRCDRRVPVLREAGL